MHSAQDRAARSSLPRRTQNDRVTPGRRVSVSRAAELLEQLEVGSDQHADAQTGRWPHRSTLLLIVSVGVIFWGGVWWLIFG